MVAAQSASLRTPSVGQRLRLRREQQERTVAELSAETCITSRYLEAIEADDQKPLPGFFFYRNYVKQYARALGLDGTQLYNELAAAAPVDDASLLATLSKEYTPNRTAAASPPRTRRWMGYVFAGFALVAASAGFSVAARSRESAPPIATVKFTSSQPAVAGQTAIQR
jgi:cytoskeletal protein RodZ